MNPNIAEAGKATRFPHNDPTKGGRRPSIRGKIKELLKAQGRVTIPASQVEEVMENGDVVLKVPTENQLAMKLISWAMSAKGNDSIKAIQMIMEQLDGKPNQTMDVTATAKREPDLDIDVNQLSAESKKELMDLWEKAKKEK